VTILRTGSIGAFRSNAIRFRVLGTRSLGQHPLNQTVPSFGLLRDGCELPGGRLTLNEAQRAVLLEFPEAVSANGYYFATSDAGSEAADVISWSVEASAGNGSTWDAVGASVWRQYGDGTLGVYSHLPYPTPVARGYRVRVDYRIPWQWVLDTVVAHAVYAVGWSLSGVSCSFGREHLAKPMALVMSVPTTLLFLAEAIGYHAEGQMFTAMSVWIEYGPAQVVWIAGLAFFEAQLIWVLLLFSLSVLATLILRDTVLYGRPIMVPLSSFLTESSGFLTLLFVMAAMYFRRRAIRRAISLVVLDRAKYDTIWAALMNDPDTLRALLDVRRATADLQGRCALPARQLNRRLLCCGRPPPGLGGPAFRLAQSAARVDAMGALELSSPVYSLDQLFVQASCLELLLCRKIKVLIVHGCGCGSTAVR
jgi:hypothetical protein